MLIHPRHHQSLLQRQDRILTSNYKLRVVDYVNPQQHSMTVVQTNGQDIAINYMQAITNLSDPRRLAAAAGANSHALGHNLRTPRLEYQLKEAFNKSGKLWRQAFNIAEDWRIECHVVDDSHVNGPYLAALFDLMDNLSGGHGADYTDFERFILTAGRLYLADEDIMGSDHIDYLKTLRDIAASDYIWDNGNRTVIDVWRQSGALREMSDSMVEVVLSNTDLHNLTGKSWADALIDHAVMYHDKLWCMRHLGHKPSDIYLPGGRMVEMINRIMILIMPAIDRRYNDGRIVMLNDSGINPAFGLWQDITFAFDQSSESDGQGENVPGSGKEGNDAASGSSPSSKSGNEDQQSSGSGEDDNGKAKGKNRGSGFMQHMNSDDCRCGTCGR